MKLVDEHAFILGATQENVYVCVCTLHVRVCVCVCMYIACACVCVCVCVCQQIDLVQCMKVCLSCMYKHVLFPSTHCNCYTALV